MTGDDLIEQFERGATPPGSFHHADHVRLAFEYLQRYPALEALGRFSDALRNYARLQGKTSLYHETITWAYLLLIRERMARAGGPQAWEEFSAQNADLMVWKDGILGHFYRKETLDSELARRAFVFPDQCP